MKVKQRKRGRDRKREREGDRERERGGEKGEREVFPGDTVWQNMW